MGANPEIIMDENHYKNAFAQRINLVAEMYKNNQKNFRFDENHTLFNSKLLFSQNY